MRAIRISPWTMLFVAAALSVLSRSVSAQDFYAGKTISLLTHATPGDGYDTYLRLLSRHMGKYIPGSPNFVIINQPGGGGILAVNYAGRVAPQDGTLLTLVSQGLLVLEATGGPGLQTSLRTFKWLGNFSQSNNVTVTWFTSKIRTLQDAKMQETIVGGTGAGSATAVGPTLYNSLLGTRFKIIFGYDGGSAINLAMQRGELDGRANATWTSIKTAMPNEVRDHKLNVLIQMGLRKEPDLPDVPLLRELVRDDPAKDAVAQFISLAVSVARPFAAPPGVPDDRVELLRRAFEATMKDSEFLAEAQHASSDIEPMTGGETQRAIETILTTPKPVIEKVQTALGGLTR